MRGDVVYCQKLDNDRFCVDEVSRSARSGVFFPQVYRQVNHSPAELMASLRRIGEVNLGLRGRKTKVSGSCSNRRQLVAPGRSNFRNPE